MTDNQTPPSDEQLPQVGWWCWRGGNHGHLATMACRSDNVPLHAPAEWADGMRAVIQRIEDGGEPEPAAGPVAAVSRSDGSLRDRIAAAIRAAACTGDCGKTEEECAKERIQPFVWHHGRLAVVEGSPEQIADAITPVLPSAADRGAVLSEAADIAEDVAIRLHRAHDVGGSLGAYETMAELRRLAAEAQPECPGVETVPNRCTCGCEGCKHHSGAHNPAEAQQPTSKPAASPSNRRALVHNAITDALSAAGDWVPLSVRIAATRAALAEVDVWHADDPTPEPAAEAHPPEHRWAAELYDPLAEEWVPGTRYRVRDRAVNHLVHASKIGPAWKDGTPTQRRIVRATTTYTVEQPAAVDTGEEASRG